LILLVGENHVLGVIASLSDRLYSLSGIEKDDLWYTVILVMDIISQQFYRTCTVIVVMSKYPLH